MKLTNEEKEKVLAMHLGCSCLIGNLDWKPLNAIGGVAPYVDVNYGKPVKTTLSLHTIQHHFPKTYLILAPLSRITDEDAVTTATISNWMGRTKKYLKNKGKEILNPECNERSTIYENMQSFQFLISRHYAVPLWFGVNHWANGKTAIELGIAIEKETVNA